MLNGSYMMLSSCLLLSACKNLVFSCSTCYFCHVKLVIISSTKAFSMFHISYNNSAQQLRTWNTTPILLKYEIWLALDWKCFFCIVFVCLLVFTASQEGQLESEMHLQLIHCKYWPTETSNLTKFWRCLLLPAFPSTNI